MPRHKDHAVSHRIHGLHGKSTARSVPLASQASASGSQFMQPDVVLHNRLGVTSSRISPSTAPVV